MPNSIHPEPTGQHPSGPKKTSASRIDQPARWGDFGPAVLLLILGIAGIVAAKIIPSSNSSQYAVITPPWYSLGQTIALIQRADGEVADIRGDRHIVIARSERPGFMLDLYRAGAWLVIAPFSQWGCGSIQARYQDRTA